jgi:RWP-RK domain
MTSNSQVRQIFKAEVEQLFHLPAHEACVALKLSSEEFTHICRAFGIKRFIYCMIH